MHCNLRCWDCNGYNIIKIVLVMRYITALQQKGIHCCKRITPITDLDMVDCVDEKILMGKQFACDDTYVLCVSAFMCESSAMWPIVPSCIVFLHKAHLASWLLAVFFSHPRYCSSSNQLSLNKHLPMLVILLQPKCRGGEPSTQRIHQTPTRRMMQVAPT